MNTKCCNQNCNQGRHCPLRKVASTLGQQVAHAQAEMATWTSERRANVRLEGGDKAQGQRTIEEQLAYYRARVDTLEAALRGRQAHIGELEKRIAELEAAQAADRIADTLNRVAPAKNGGA